MMNINVTLHQANLIRYSVWQSGRVGGGGGGGGWGGCGQRIEVFVKIKKNIRGRGGEVGAGEGRGWSGDGGGGQCGCAQRIEV